MMHKNSNSETHWVCNRRIAKEGEKATCCDCFPHNDCGEVEKVLNPMNQGQEKEFEEKGAEIEHERWAKWQKYLHSKLKYVEYEENGVKRAGYLMDAGDYEHWESQIDRTYAELSEVEKESDRVEARTYLPLLRHAIQTAREEEQKNEFDCFSDGCGECTVCKYLNFLDNAYNVCPPGGMITTNQFIEKYLKRRNHAIQTAREEGRQEFANEIIKMYDTLPEKITGEKARAFLMAVMFHANQEKKKKIKTKDSR